jgi:hypothetical protein
VCALCSHPTRKRSAEQQSSTSAQKALSPRCVHNERGWKGRRLYSTALAGTGDETLPLLPGVRLQKGLHHDPVVKNVMPNFTLAAPGSLRPTLDSPVVSRAWRQPKSCRRSGSHLYTPPFEPMADWRRLLCSKGVTPFPAWMDELESWARAHHVRGSLEQLAWEQLLGSDLRGICASSLPDVFDLHNRHLDGPLLLQIEDWRDVSRPKAQGDGLMDMEAEAVAEDEEAMFGRRAPKAADLDEQTRLGPKRMLKMLCSEGTQDILAFEYRPCSVLDPARLRKGCKIVVRRCRVLRGHLALTPECLEFVGGGFAQEPVSDAAASVVDDEEAAMEALRQVEEQLAQRSSAVAQVPASAVARAPVAAPQRAAGSTYQGGAQQQPPRAPPAAAVATASSVGAPEPNVKPKRPKKYLSESDDEC